MLPFFRKKDPGSLIPMLYGLFDPDPRHKPDYVMMGFSHKNEFAKENLPLW